MRSLAFFRCDCGVAISVGDDCDVQWGRAVVLSSGNEQELRQRMREMERVTDPASPTSHQGPLSSSPPASPAPKQRKIPASLVSKLLSN